MYVIGTAGHVDHGKSTLVEALTGIDPDRLREEKEREMTIDLGFAWLHLGEGEELEEVGVVDVPGHRDFIENMLAGVGGIDLALFVVAADEGVMPQTREHLAILDLLEIRTGVVAVTKVDLVEDDDWLELVILDLAETLQGTTLADAPIVAVSGHTGHGLQELRRELAAALERQVPRKEAGLARLPVDRAFTLSGFGTIVTGTLVGGSLDVGDSVEIQPAGHSGRVRGLQTHRVARETARPGSRVAVNISGVDADEVRRGDVLAAPGAVRGTILLDAAYRHLPGAPAPLRHNMEVKLFVGAAEVMARARVLGARQIAPGETGWLQLALSEPVAVARSDRFILRRPGRRHRRFRPEVLSRMQTLAEGTPAELLLQRLGRLEPALPAELLRQSGLPREVAQPAWERLQEEEEVAILGRLAVTTATLQGWRERLASLLGNYHRQYPLRAGMPREEARSRLRLDAAVFNPLVSELASGGLLVEEGAVLREPDHAIVFSPAQEARVEQLLSRFEAAGASAPTVKESREAVGDDVYEALIALGRLRPLNAEIVYRVEEYERLVEQITAYLREQGRANAAQVRDLLGASRKYAIALLEHLDEQRITRRIGDERELIR